MLSTNYRGSTMQQTRADTVAFIVANVDKCELIMMSVTCHTTSCTVYYFVKYFCLEYPCQQAAASSCQQVWTKPTSPVVEILSCTRADGLSYTRVRRTCPDLFCSISPCYGRAARLIPYHTPPTILFSIDYIVLVHWSAWRV